MNPRKAKELLPDVSVTTNLPLDLLEDLTDFYWRDIHKTVVSLDEYHVLVPHVGTFHIKGSEYLIPEIEKIEKIVNVYKDKPPRSQYRYVKWDHYRTKLAKLKILLEQYYQEQEAKKQNKALRKQIYNDSQNLEQQETNP